jgi:predicted phage terminase large subunit-like protein
MKKVKEKRKIFAPSSIKQQLVLQENNVDILLTGGGAGSGKSFLLLLKAVHAAINDPAAKIMILRLTYPMLKDLISASKQIFPHFGGVYKTQARTWIFPNSSEIDFKAMPKDLYEVQGWERTTYVCDEAAEFQKSDILALMTRLRSTTYKGKLAIWLSCNPSKTSWLREVVDYSLDFEGVPLAGTEYKTRHFVVQNSDFKWADSEDELYEKYGQGLKKGVEFVGMKFKFIPMLCTDNMVLMKQDPAYVGRLLATSRVNMLRLLRGSWEAAIEGSTVVTEDLFEIVDHPPINPKCKYIGWDLASSIPNEANQFRADYTVGVLASKDEFGNFYIEDVVRFQRQIDGVLTGIKDFAWKSGLDVLNILPSDPGQAGKVASRFYTTHLAGFGVGTRVENSNPHSNKLTRFQPFASLAHNNLIKIVRGSWNKDYLDELCTFTGERSSGNVHDDQCDATSTVINQLARTQTIPTFVVPSLTKSSPVPTI